MLLLYTMTGHLQQKYPWRLIFVENIISQGITRGRSRAGDLSCLARVIEARRSCRSYRPDPVPRKCLETMLEAARLAPSACNRQPWRFVVATRQELREAMASQGLLPGLSARWVAEAPVLIVMGMRRSILTHRVAPWVSGVDYPWIDLGIAGEHLVLQATAMGLGTCWIGWIRPRVIRKLVGWPAAVQPAIVFTVGWPCSERGGPAARPEWPAAADEIRETERWPLSDLVKWLE